jgi:hypothetical protein
VVAEIPEVGGVQAEMEFLVPVQRVGMSDPGSVIKDQSFQSFRLPDVYVRREIGHFPFCSPKIRFYKLDDPILEE